MDWNGQVKHDRPLITNCSVRGLACAAGLKPSSAAEERDLDMLLTNLALADQEGRPCPIPEIRATPIATQQRGVFCQALRR
jgi:hypothetical protein